MTKFVGVMVWWAQGRDVGAADDGGKDDLRALHRGRRGPARGGRAAGDRARACRTGASPVQLKLPPYHWWRTVFFLIPAISVYTIVLGAASIVSSVFDRRGQFAHACARAWSWLILKTTGVRVAIEGLDRIVPGTTYVFVSNHQSIYDTPVIFASLPYQLRIIAKTSLARFPVLGWHLRARRPPVRRSPASRSRGHPQALARPRVGRTVAASSTRKGRGAPTAASAASRPAASCSRFRPGCPSCRWRSSAPAR